MSTSTTENVTRAETNKRAEEAALQAALTAKADAFMEQLKSGALTLA